VVSTLVGILFVLFYFLIGLRNAELLLHPMHLQDGLF